MEKVNDFEYFKTQGNRTIEHGNKELVLTEEAFPNNYGTNGEVRYHANAIDADGNEYRVVWETTVEWDLCSELAQLELKENYGDISNEEKERMDELIISGYSSEYIEDESNACDWSEPYDIEEI